MSLTPTLTWRASPQPARRPRPRRPRVPIASIVTAAVVGGLLVALAMVAGPASPVRQGDGLPALAWADDTPRPLFAVDDATLAGLPHTFQARRNTGGGRQDSLTVGVFGHGTALRLTLDRPGRDAGTPEPLPAAVARQAADAGLTVATPGAQGFADTRLGGVETMDVTASRAGASPLPCTGFRLALAGARVGMTGLLCDGGRDARRAAIGCILDSLRFSTAAGGVGPRTSSAGLSPANPACRQRIRA